jgi:putative DNA primase/helicase
VSDVLDTLTAITHLPEDIDPPAWLDHPDPPVSADRIVACANGLLDVGTRKLHPLTPRFFNRVAVPFAYQPESGEPVRWLAFLRQLWPDDPDSIAALQEFFGYVLSGRTDLQKILLLIGPTRSGKGTIARILAALVGRGNSAGPTLASLGTNFGLSPLLGKPLAIVSDARLGGANVHQVVERLLSISGEDMLTVDRKFREPWTGKLPARFIVLSNELPRFGDASGAIANRFIVLAMNASFLGKENTRLTVELLAELPAILGWALDGLDRLAKSNTFTTPASSGDAISALQDLVSPVAAFVRDTCTVGAGHQVLVSDLYDRWRSWCDDNGHKASSVQTFGRDLRAVVPALRVFRPHAGERSYIGLILNGSHNGACRGSSGSRPSGDDVNRTEPRHEPLQPQHGKPSCEDCGQTLLLTAPGRTLCARCELARKESA